MNAKIKDGTLHIIAANDEELQEIKEWSELNEIGKMSSVVIRTKITFPVKEERNNALYKDRIEGKMSYKDLAEKYGISATRCRDVVGKIESKKRKI